LGGATRARLREAFAFFAVDVFGFFAFVVFAGFVAFLIVRLLGFFVAIADMVRASGAGRTKARS
jgi:hypothetical protein